MNFFGTQVCAILCRNSSTTIIDNGGLGSQSWASQVNCRGSATLSTPLHPVTSKQLLFPSATPSLNSCQVVIAPGTKSYWTLYNAYPLPTAKIDHDAGDQSTNNLQNLTQQAQLTKWCDPNLKVIKRTVINKETNYPIEPTCQKHESPMTGLHHTRQTQPIFLPTCPPSLPPPVNTTVNPNTNPQPPYSRDKVCQI